MKIIRYIVDKNKHGDIEGLLRLVEDENIGMWGEVYYDGKWHRNNSTSAFMQDPGYGDFIYTEEEAKPIIEFLDKRDGIVR